MYLDHVNNEDVLIADVTVEHVDVVVGENGEYGVRIVAEGGIPRIIAVCAYRKYAFYLAGIARSFGAIPFVHPVEDL